MRSGFLQYVLDYMASRPKDISSSCQPIVSNLRLKLLLSDPQLAKYLWTALRHHVPCPAGLVGRVSNVRTPGGVARLAVARCPARLCRCWMQASVLGLMPRKLALQVRDDMEQLQGSTTLEAGVQTYPSCSCHAVRPSCARSGRTP